jgi:hypothetical protein
MHDIRLESLVAALDIRVETLEQEVNRLREWRHNMPSDLIIPIQNELQGMKEILRDATRRSFGLPAKKDHLVSRRDVALVLATVTITVTVLVFFDKIKPLLP